MKKKALALMMLMGAAAANAQTWVGGSLGFEYGKTDDLPKMEFSITPTIGYDLNDKWAIGLDLSFSHSNQETLLNSSQPYSHFEKDHSNAFAITPFVRYTFAKAGIVAFFVDGLVEYSYRNSKYEQYATYSLDDWAIPQHKEEQKYINGYFRVGFRPGVSFDLGKHFLLVSNIGTLSYRHQIHKRFDNGQTETSEEAKGDVFGLKLANSLNVGMIYKF